MRQIETTFDSMGAHPAVDGSSLGERQLTDELEKFLDGWSQGRSSISKSLASVVQVVQNALTVYQHTEQEIASAEGQSAPSGGASANSSSGNG
jgi:hypothetical protein